VELFEVQARDRRYPLAARIEDDHVSA
jgi:hypothetical protein